MTHFKITEGYISIQTPHSTCWYFKGVSNSNVRCLVWTT